MKLSDTILGRNTSIGLLIYFAFLPFVFAAPGDSGEGPATAVCTGEEIRDIGTPKPGFQDCPDYDSATGYDQLCLWFAGSFVQPLRLQCPINVVRCTVHDINTAANVPANWSVCGQCYATLPNPHTYLPLYCAPIVSGGCHSEGC